MADSETIRALAKAGAVVTSGPVADDSTRGWGHPPFSRGKMIAHHWTALARHPDDPEDVTGYRSACGVFTISTSRVPLLGAGNLPYCQRCENKLMKEGE